MDLKMIKGLETFVALDPCSIEYLFCNFGSVYCYTNAGLSSMLSETSNAGFRLELFDGDVERVAGDAADNETCRFARHLGCSRCTLRKGDRVATNRGRMLHYARGVAVANFADAGAWAVLDNVDLARVDGAKLDDVTVVIFVVALQITLAMVLKSRALRQGADEGR